MLQKRVGEAKIKEEKHERKENAEKLERKENAEDDVHIKNNFIYVNFSLIYIKYEVDYSTIIYGAFLEAHSYPLQGVH